MSIYDVSGRLINTLKNSNVLPGFYKIKWTGNDLKGQSMPTGVYFYQLESGNFSQTKKLLLVK